MSYEWLENTGQGWKVTFEVWVGLFGFASVLLGLASLLFSAFAGPKVLWPAGVLWGIYGLLRATQYVIVYHCIRCPRCGFNPTRRAADGRVMHEKTMYARLAKLQSCPQCGDGGG
jgi:hypothetical protein